ncbi:superoxide dismutase [Desulfurivibrio alkaliphilus]|uniref:Superoxide dismutase n=1 Tax=Desulfurivibrio alkaliphilus (strain DSM 19089 / UNIQEM U267 / AHT2) TaxID=589865 RepID=D6Z323_DESAT|nr:superoxide dismutase [Desulfurivibrio alkaliphilus]ADH85948.1 Superoxide dismutase [Desulfurivibrio alkaliphilus AHT 2]
MTLVLPQLPYAQNALEPHISARTLEFHHGKHHQAYVDNGNKLLASSDLKGLPMEEIIKKTAADPAAAGIFNNVAQVWNHSFYWQSMKPGGGGAPTGRIAAMIDADFGGLAGFAEAFKTAGATQFGSGWAWLVLDEASGRLKVVKTPNAETPLTMGMKPLLTMDVWEHAYYLDYQNRRPDYMTTFVEKLINWDFVNANLG